MGTMTERLDTFVRWFFNSSPDSAMIEPMPTPYRPFAFERQYWVRQGALGGALVVALVLLAVFYSVVAGAVEHAAVKRNEAMAGKQGTAAVVAHVQRARPVVVARAGS